MGKKDGGGDLVPAKGLAEEMGVTTQTLRDWQEVKGFPGTVSHGKYSRGAVNRWAVEYIKRLEASPAIVDADERLKTIKAMREELKYEGELGKVVAIDAVERQWAGAITEAREILLGVPTRCAAEISPGGEYSRENLLAVIDGVARRSLKALERGEFKQE